MTQAERQAAREEREEQARRAATGGSAAGGTSAAAPAVDSGGTQNIVVASAASTTEASKPAAPSVSLYQQGKALESGGNVKGAVRLYLRAIKEGDYNAAKALGDIYSEGKGDVLKDYADSLRYYQLAKQHGVEVPLQRGR
jgi:serine/threonine-protein kinase